MKYTYLLIALCLLAFSCNRDDMDLNTSNPVDNGQPMVKVEGSVVGLIVDEVGDPVEDAIVSLGNVSTTTNEFGTFVFIDEEIYADGTYVKVDKPGYFPGSRRFNAIAGEQNNIKVRLVEKREVGVISAENGGEVTVSTAKIVLPAGTYIYPDGSSYAGPVSVYATYLDPSKSETFEEMPGDLSGIDSEGALNALATFGMVGVELEDGSGRKVNLPEGSKSELRIALPSALIAVAPETIPLWHFDEERGIWIEEGEAALENGVYVGEVEHFSWWNCDYPIPSVELNGQVFLNGNTADGVKVQVTDAITGFSGCTYTSNRGFFAGGIPSGNVLLLRVMDPCGDVMYEQEIGPFDSDVTLTPIAITTTLETVTLSGVVTNCTGDPIFDSAVIINFGSTQSMVLCESDGTFVYNTPPCQNGMVEVFGYDITNSLISPPSIVEFSGVQDVGTLIACEDFFEPVQFIEYDNKNWGDNNVDSTLVGYAVEIDSFVNGATTEIKLTFTMIDWLQFDPETELLQYQGVYTYTLGEDTAELVGQMQSQGFEISGTTTYEEINQAGKRYVRFMFNTSEREIIDSSLFPGDVGLIRTNISIPLD